MKCEDCKTQAPIVERLCRANKKQHGRTVCEIVTGLVPEMFVDIDTGLRITNTSLYVVARLKERIENVK